MTAPKRKRTDTDPAAAPPPTKRPCLTSSLNLASEDDTRALGAVETNYDVQLQSVISSSKIQQRVTAMLRHLSPPSDSTTTPHHKEKEMGMGKETATGKTRISVLRARAPDAGKLISIAEIAKRELGKQGGADRKQQLGQTAAPEPEPEPAPPTPAATPREPSSREAGRWYQYIALGEEKKERPRDEGKTMIVEETVLGGKANDNDDHTQAHEDEDADGDDFEVMKTPFERAIEGRPLVRGVPIMSLFLSRVPVEELRRRYGEQTNAPPI
ncbi:Uu.00g104150.m01.CDS01 [Anthostomella pinea]|uniref:Uu.00g104150.m01.CDS01 n=1 Tax=Anthostomella pinea TaxID=933095 RepID=A0AAI8VDJ4_9PEZI|nr:Uu.00g104150.m01.CDS01 [Anthostomella pinea]